MLDAYSANDDTPWLSTWRTSSSAIYRACPVKYLRKVSALRQLPTFARQLPGAVQRVVDSFFALAVREKYTELGHVTRTGKPHVASAIQKMLGR
jgi:hypothetical protein